MACSGNKGAVLNTTRRTSLAAAAASIAATSAAGRSARGGDRTDQVDPAVSLWRDWLAAHRLYSEACRRQQKLETEMLRELGSFPRVKIGFSEGDGFMWAYTTEEIDRLLPNPDQTETRRAARAKLAERRADWNAVDARIGYSRAKKAEAELAEVESALAKELWNTSSQSVAGIAAKLHCVLETEDPGSGLEEAPWPELRTILSDLVQICGSRHPG
ncbi:Hypothetical protein RG1141_PB00250 (plasmid) [Neorhizobium galegae bv. officinalis bv. officinalis str. HAMBI 1141]|uniref:Uncharacterized protein n=4 Tax=Neorhizobium galegae TaxID=399 RepID=A0A0T7G0E0_NEOGA|nr:Hypothetical protein RG1141_PB00250 [Neorhizobium galegae bv. officinalis bv. officinalis str. HAMBI 1141]CDZ30265.1 Hypothetical protein NGAL_HAMBI490_51330 [Neorhizobium galegae bv. officinalis]CDZ40716.1 Hypothetical protein NGAL_HAMBI1145_55350 [Neorhizobium galegae bv. officinalis]CDZ53626.1 Hypothetical protein NGAL_HAMBI1189_50900 [Neorhizobium galegae bv. officinalis]